MLTRIDDIPDNAGPSCHPETFHTYCRSEVQAVKKCFFDVAYSLDSFRVLSNIETNESFSGSIHGGIPKWDCYEDP